MRRLVAAAAALAGTGLCALVAVPLLLTAALAGGSGSGGVPSAVAGIHPVLLDAYVKAAARAGEVAPGCTGVRWSILAGIGQVESGQAQGRTITPTGDVAPPIIGPALDGSGVGGNTTPVYDTDRGEWDQDSVYDHAVGVLQFLPSTWVVLGEDGNGDGRRDPHNVYDDALAAVRHLCGTAARDLADPEQLATALYGYNHSQTYVSDVLQWIATYDQLGAIPPDSAGGSARAQAVVAAAEKWLGTPYAWGGGDARGPTRGVGHGAGTVGFDCSGLTLYAYAQVGITLPHSSQVQSTMGQRIARSAGLAALQPGDLVFFAIDPVTGAGVHHVGIYLGGGQMVNAPHTGAVVRVEPVWMDSYAGAARWP